jgi:CubicO group peptidase (beta-lactamase class C family)
MNRFRFTRILLIAVAILAVAYAMSPLYLRYALLYQQPDLDDYTIFSNRVVMAGEYQPWSESPGFGSKTIPQTYEKQFDKLKTVAFLVIKEEKIVFEKYWKGYSAESRFNSFSMAPSIVSLLIGAAVDEGYIKSVDQPAGDFIPAFRTGDKAKITIRHLLEMSSGLSWDESYSSLTSMTTKGYYGDDINSLVLEQAVVREPGIYFDYKSGNTQLLAIILAYATGRNISTYASEKLWIPMGAQGDALWSMDKATVVEKAFCCFNANMRDFARIGELALNRGRWFDRQLVSESYMNQAFAPSGQLIDSQSKLVSYYGWQWWLMNYRGYSVYYMMGLNGQYVIAVPELKMVIVRFGKKSSTELIRGIPADFFTWFDAGMELAGLR